MDEVSGESREKRVPKGQGMSQKRFLLDGTVPKLSGKRTEFSIRLYEFFFLYPPDALSLSWRRSRPFSENGINLIRRRKGYLGRN